MNVHTSICVFVYPDHDKVRVVGMVIVLVPDNSNNNKNKNMCIYSPLDGSFKVAHTSDKRRSLLRARAAPPRRAVRGGGISGVQGRAPMAAFNESTVEYRCPFKGP